MVEELVLNVGLKALWYTIKTMKNIKIASMGVLSRCHQNVYNNNNINNNNIPQLKVSSFLSLMDRK